MRLLTSLAKIWWENPAILIGNIILNIFTYLEQLHIMFFHSTFYFSPSGDLLWIFIEWHLSLVSEWLFLCAKALGAVQEKKFIAVYLLVKGSELRGWGFGDGEMRNILEVSMGMVLWDCVLQGTESSRSKLCDGDIWGQAYVWKHVFCFEIVKARSMQSWVWQMWLAIPYWIRQVSVL